MVSRIQSGWSDFLSRQRYNYGFVVVGYIFSTAGQKRADELRYFKSFQLE